MLAGVKKTLSVIAIYTIALHAVLWAFAGSVAAEGTNDFLSVICHSVAPDSAGGAPSPVLPDHSHACDHCNLCSSVGPPPVPDIVVAARLAPARVLDVLRPADRRLHDGRTSDPKRARGPPQLA
jgi:hypothetical protein